MSIDLEWNRLDSSLASTLVDLINRQLASTTRPSFIGPIEVTSFDLGANAPDVELVDLRDIYRDFLEDDEDEEEDDGALEHGTEPSSSRAGLFPGEEGEDEDDDFEWVSRKAVRGKGLVGDDAGPAYHLLPPHVRYGAAAGASLGMGGMGMDMLHSTPFLRAPRDIWSPSFASLPTSAPSNEALPPHSRASPAPDPDAAPSPPRPGPAPHPNLQLHLHITWASNLRLTLTTALLINYPSPMFMALPIRLSVTGLLFAGELVVAYEGARRRVHLCVVDDLDPYGPLGGAGDRRARGTPSPRGGSGASSSAGSSTGDPLPIGQRLLPRIDIESEIGQADKHVLKNVGRVERFIQDVIRKTVEEELVFPNFQTFVLGEPEA
ncbi:uncharacterized protein BXZ73DRAFT_47147 [Epithele typhae]|uniref:uncharacterized protein n=1 Tax=Epithele typhae TaxID=378194 RepID=UPI0020088DDD|nr:uncharacterized protein BXZ73DRAFT_47147 [Epithele typhae]KAH9931694.1 hypothetical protein BXZ73DRAFT_47147 [Epithele typhae]